MVVGRALARRTGAGGIIRAWAVVNGEAARAPVGDIRRRIIENDWLALGVVWAC